MAWAKVDDGFYLHPKITVAGNAAVGAWVRALSYCAAHFTGGYVTQTVADIVANPDEQDALTDSGLWKQAKAGDSITVTGRKDSGRRALTDATVKANSPGFFIVDFLHYHPTREEAEALRSKRSGAGAKGGKQAPAEANAQAPDTADAQAFAALPARGVPTRPDPSTPKDTPSSRNAARAKLDDEDIEGAINALKPSRRQLARALDALENDTDRLRVCITHVLDDPTVEKLAPYLDELLANGSWPEPFTPPPTLARGATGTRSSSPTLPDRPAQPEPKPTPPPKDFLALAGRTTEPPAPPPTPTQEKPQ